MVIFHLVFVFFTIVIQSRASTLPIYFLVHTVTTCEIGIKREDIFHIPEKPITQLDLLKYKSKELGQVMNLQEYSQNDMELDQDI